MSSSMVKYFAAFAVIFAHTVIFPVKGQCTVQGCENGDSSNSIVAEMQQLFAEAFRQQQNEQVQFIHEILNASFQQIKKQQDTVMRSLEAVLQLLLYQDVSTKNQTQYSWKLATGLPVQSESDTFLGDGPVLLPIVNNWIVFLNHFDGSLSFNRTWTEYKNGFGVKGRGDFWLGNENIHRLTNSIGVGYSLRIELYASGRWFYAEYANFSLDPESNKYTLRLSGFSGNAGDSLTNMSIHRDLYHGGMSFSTWDSDNDRFSGNCASDGGGWWYNGCAVSCLTCPYVNPFRWYSLRHVSMNGVLQAARMMMKSK